MFPTPLSNLKQDPQASFEVANSHHNNNGHGDYAVETILGNRPNSEYWRNRYLQAPNRGFGVNVYTHPDSKVVPPSMAAAPENTRGLTYSTRPVKKHHAHHHHHRKSASGSSSWFGAHKAQDPARRDSPNSFLIGGGPARLHTSLMGVKS